MEGGLDWFYILAAANTGVQVSHEDTDSVSFLYMTSYGNPGMGGTSIFSTLNNL